MGSRSGQHEDAEVAEKARWAEELAQQKQRAERALEQQRVWADNMKRLHLEEVGLPMYPLPQEASDPPAACEALRTVSASQAERMREMEDAAYDDPVDAAVCSWQESWRDENDGVDSSLRGLRKRRGRRNNRDDGQSDKNDIKKPSPSPASTRKKEHSSTRWGQSSGWQPTSCWEDGGGWEQRSAYERRNRKERGGGYDRGGGWEESTVWEGRRGGGAGKGSKGGSHGNPPAAETSEPKSRSRGKFLLEHEGQHVDQSEGPFKPRRQGKFAREETTHVAEVSQEGDERAREPGRRHRRH